jgi:hypothetical protein
MGSNSMLRNLARKRHLQRLKRLGSPNTFEKKKVKLTPQVNNRKPVPQVNNRKPVPPQVNNRKPVPPPPQQVNRRPPPQVNNRKPVPQHHRLIGDRFHKLITENPFHNRHRLIGDRFHKLITENPFHHLFHNHKSIIRKNQTTRRSKRLTGSKKKKRHSWKILKKRKTVSRI